ncbi:hypothetical protein L1987_80841 [Smallanthus sonchifolius]|uniref:Uncharacterized protein n=1 Tax=Smallanthus sonchifolius TaxID=185202 RepID=A0ACB8YQ25_9ASTR|nr:hypothetical protein L1987_80841 [Smallanthus sonchifolius]
MIFNSLFVSSPFVDYLFILLLFLPLIDDLKFLMGNRVTMKNQLAKELEYMMIEEGKINKMETKEGSLGNYNMCVFSLMWT